MYILTNQWIRIIVEIIFILLLNTKQDYENFISNPKEFVDLEIDIVENKVFNQTFVL